jgi:phospholipase/carboxylesterase
MASYQKGKLNSRPNRGPNLGSTTTGLRRTGLETKRDGALYVPDSLNHTRPVPLMITLHGAGGDAHHGIDPFRDLANHTGTILLAPESQGSTWDLILGRYDKDVYWMDEALSDVFSLYPIDPKHLAIAGFSDGASYALSVGMANADLFSHIIAFSPGFASSAESDESPKIYISHGKNDNVLPIDPCSRKIVQRIKEEGFDLTYHEFDGGHTIPPDIGREAFNWFLGQETAAQETRDALMPITQSGIEFT